MSLPVQTQTEDYNKLPWRIRFKIGIVIWILNKICDDLEPYSMAPYFCINSYIESEDDWENEITKVINEPTKH